jgi:hypothetical protein
MHAWETPVKSGGGVLQARQYAGLRTVRSDLQFGPTIRPRGEIRRRQLDRSAR